MSGLEDYDDSVDDMEEEMDLEEKEEFDMLNEKDLEERMSPGNSRPDSGAGNSMCRGRAITIRRLVRL